eukprot:s360_g8.t1
MGITSHVVLEWPGKKNKNEDQDDETPAEPSNHPLEGFSCSKEELEQEAEQRAAEVSVEPEAPSRDTCAPPAEPKVECKEPPVPTTVIDQDSQASQVPPAVEESPVPRTPEKAPGKAVLVEDSQELEYFQEDQTLPEHKEGDGHGVGLDTMEIEPCTPAEPTLGGAAPSQPATPSREHLEALEREEEKDGLKSDEEELAKRQAFKAGFKDRKPLFELEDLPELTEEHLKAFPGLSGLQRDTRKDINAERRDAERELKEKREKTEKRAQGKGKGRGRGRGRGRKAAQGEPVEEGVPGKEQDEAIEHLPDMPLQRLRSKRAHESDESEPEARKDKR